MKIRQRWWKALPMGPVRLGICRISWICGCDLGIPASRVCPGPTCSRHGVYLVPRTRVYRPHSGVLTSASGRFCGPTALQPAPGGFGGGFGLSIAYQFRPGLQGKPYCAPKGARVPGIPCPGKSRTAQSRSAPSQATSSPTATTNSDIQDFWIFGVPGGRGLPGGLRPTAGQQCQF